MAFLNRQYRTIAILAIFAAIIVGVVLALLGQGTSADKFSLAWHTSLAFLIGAILFWHFRLHRHGRGRAFQQSAPPAPPRAAWVRH